MLHRLLSHFKQFDWAVFGPTILLVGCGLTAIYSVALGNGEVSLLNFYKQSIFAAAGLALLFLFSAIDFHSFYSWHLWLYWIGIVILILVLFFGVPVRGTRSWFELLGFSLQPSEFIKIILIICLARYFSSASYKVGQLKHLAHTGLLVLIPSALILWQPDFGSAMVIFTFWLSLVAIFGLSHKQILVIILISLFFFAVSFFVLLKDYQKERIMTFLNPSISSLDKGYNVAQAIIAIGSGGVAGKGLGFGSQSQLKFLPESQTDFIFAVIGEELGFLGILFIMACFAALFFRLLYWVTRINNNFGLYIILGAVCLLFIEMVVNVGMNMGLLPVVGITLPFVSYGGSSLLASLILIGVVESVIIHARHN